MDSSQKVRRDGNSLVIPLPADVARALSLADGDEVEIEANTTSGHILVRPARSAQPGLTRIGELIDQVVDENKGLLDRLAKA